MRVVVSEDALNARGVRSHYCLALEKTIGLHVSGRPELADVFCPMCGALSPWDRDKHFPDRLSRPEQYDGPLCKHGEPDALCTDLAATSEWATYELKHAYRVLEYPAAELAVRYGCAPTVIQWVRYCIECRQEFARANLPLLRYELTRIHAAVAEESRIAQRALLEIGEEIRRLNGATAELERSAAAPESGPERRLGFVYLIGHSSALKIGWTERHPAEGRLPQLQTATEKRLEIIGYVLGTVDDERELHGRFAIHRIRGEWFHPAQEIRTYFQENQP